MRTAIISDLHLGSRSGRDLLRDEFFRDLLLAEIERADRLVLLGDVIELFEVPFGEAFENARPFLKALGVAMAGRQIILVPGNHDHLLARPLLKRAASRSEPLGLEHRAEPSGETNERLARWLGAAELEFAYPGIWLREDVYATHGHYMDCHRHLPRLECIAAATVMRVRGPIPDRASPADYERVLTPVYRLAFRLAQTHMAHRLMRPSDQAWQAISSGGIGEERREGRSAVRGGVSVGVGVLNRMLRSELKTDLGPEALSETGIAAAAELASRLEIDAEHVITGHTHRPGPAAGESAWPLPDGGRLHNTGSWIITSSLRDLSDGDEPYLPGTVTWLEDSEPPRRTSLLADHSAAGAVGRERMAGL